MPLNKGNRNQNEINSLSVFGKLIVMNLLPVNSLYGEFIACKLYMAKFRI